MARQVCEDQKSSGGFCYGDVSTSMQAHLANQIQGFVSDPDMFNLTNGMEMIGFPKNLPQHTTDNMWKTFIPKPPQQTPPSSSKTINDSSTNYYHHHNYTNKPPTDFSSETSGENNLIVQGLHDSATWQVDDSSLRCVFPCEGDQRPSQGLSLSLSSNNPSSIGLQSFDLRQHQQNDFASSTSRTSSQQQQQILLQDSYFMLKNSKYLIPAQELLNEFVSLGINESQVPKQQKSQINGDGSGSSKSKNSPTCLEFAELQKRKTKLLSMLEEVDRRYKHYRNQMKAVVASFEAVAGKGAAKVYSALALRAMSRHFRCLKDGILAQMEATRKAMGERDTAAPGTTRGETPRLKAIDQALRQQRAFQQMSMMETHPWRPQRGLPERSVSVLRAWLFEHFLHPYPSDVDKHILSRQTGLTRSQVSNWFINARVRLWKPMVEEMYLEEVKERENNNIAASSDGGTDQDDDIIQNQPSSSDQKPTPEHLTRMESECASSIMKNNTKGTTLHMMNPQVTDGFGSVELDFATYAQHSSGMVSYGSNGENGNNNNQQSMNNNGGVSLTLGLQQHGVSLAFPPPSHQSSLLYQTRDQMETVQYSLLDGEGQNLPYRNLMGAQLLHDLAG